MARHDWAPHLAAGHKPPGRQSVDEQVGSAVDWGCLVLRLGAVCRSLRDALLGPHASELWSAESFSGTHVSLVARPRSGAARSRRRWKLAQRAQGLHRLLARQGVQPHTLLCSGGRWLLPDLQEALGLLTGLHHLLCLVDINSHGEAGCISAALRSSSVTRIVFRGDLPVEFPECVQVLRLSQRLGWKCLHPAALLDSLQRLQRLRVLELDLPDWALNSGDVQCWTLWLPQLQELYLHLDVFPEQHDMAALALLPPSVQTGVRLLADYWSSRRLILVLQQLRDVSVTDLTICCLSCTLNAAAEAHLAQCRISRRLTLGLLGAPARRLQQLPKGPEVLYQRTIWYNIV